MRFYAIASLLICAAAAAPLPAGHVPYDGTLGGVLKTLAPVTGAVGDVVNKLTNDLGQAFLTMRLVALTTIIAAACAAPLAVRQTFVGDSDSESKQVNGPVAVDHPNINNGALEEGSIGSDLSLDGAVIAGASGNSLTNENNNFNFHDNIVSNPTLNLASNTEGGAIVGSGNQVLAPGDNNGPQNIAFKREAHVDVSNVNAPSAVNDPTINNGALSEGSMDPDLSLDDATIMNPVGNSLAQVNDNTDVSDNNFVDPTFNQISNNDGPALAGDDNVFIPINNQGMIVNLDPGFIQAQQASQQALINHFIHPGFGF